MASAYAGDVRKLIQEVAKTLVDHPDEVQVDAVPEGEVLVLELTVAETDMGRVIGKSGRTARALRGAAVGCGSQSQQALLTGDSRVRGGCLPDRRYGETAIVDGEI